MGLGHWFRTSSGPVPCDAMCGAEPRRWQRWGGPGSAPQSPLQGVEAHTLISVGIYSLGLLMFLFLFPVHVLIAGSHH